MSRFHPFSAKYKKHELYIRFSEGQLLTILCLFSGDNMQIIWKSQHVQSTQNNVFFRGKPQIPTYHDSLTHLHSTYHHQHTIPGSL